MDLDASFLNTIAIVVGILFFNSCPAEPFLPVFLIVYGIPSFYIFLITYYIILGIVMV